MQEKKNSTAFKILIILFIVLIASVLLCRDHFILGTLLIIGRWGFLCTGILLLFLTGKRIFPKKLQYFLIGILVLIGFEYIFTRLNEASVVNNRENKTVSLLTYNLFFKNKSPKIILKQIEQENPDILIVQELTPEWINLLSIAIQKKYPYKVLYSDKGTHGLGVYSKYKLSKDSLLLNTAGKPFAQVMEVSISGISMQLINTHLASPAAAVEHPENFFTLFHSNYVGIITL